MKIKVSLLILSIILASCAVKKHIGSGNTDKDEFEYYALFTEATNRAILNDNYTAVELYKNCIKRFPQRGAPYSQLSQIYQTNTKYYDLAKSYARKAVERENNNKWYLLNLASFYNYERNVDSLLLIYERLVSVTNELEYKYQLANLYSLKGEFKKALVLSDELNNEMKDTKEILMLKHKIYDALNQKDSAVGILESLILMFPEENDNYGMLAEYLTQINQTDKANATYLELLKRAPDNGMANISYADFFNRQEKKDSAIKYYMRGFDDPNINFEDKASIIYGFVYNEININKDSSIIKSLIHKLKADYNDSRGYVIDAEYNMKRDKYHECLIQLDSAIKKGDSTYIVWERYIIMCNYLGKHEEINKIYKKAIGKFPKAINLFLFSGYSLLNLKLYDNTLTLCDSALKIEPIKLEDEVQLYNMKADAFRGKGMFNESDSIYEIILQKDPENLMIRNNYSYYLSVRKKNLSRAEELSRLTIQKEARNSTYLDTYGWIQFQMGNTKDALRYIEMAIKNGAYNNSEVLEHYGEIMFQLNRCEEAIEAWQEAIKYDNSMAEKLNLKIDNVKENCLNE